jgi:hypothetical protein
VGDELKQKEDATLSMDVPEEVRVIHIFLREATCTKYYQMPDYKRFKYLAKNIYHYVGLDRTIQGIIKNFYEKVLKHFVAIKVYESV